MHRGITIAVAAALTVAMMGADGGCKERDGYRSDRPASDRQVDADKARQVQIHVEGSGPYTLFIHSQDASGKGGSDQLRRTVAGGKFDTTLDYTSGRRIDIKVSANGHERDSFYCKITDGGNVDWERSKGKVFCQLTTRQ